MQESKSRYSLFMHSSLNLHFHFKYTWIYQSQHKNHANCDPFTFIIWRQELLRSTNFPQEHKLQFFSQWVTHQVATRTRAVKTFIHIHSLAKFCVHINTLFWSCNSLGTFQPQHFHQKVLLLKGIFRKVRVPQNVKVTTPTRTNAMFRLSGNTYRKTPR